MTCFSLFKTKNKNNGNTMCLVLHSFSVFFIFTDLLRKNKRSLLKKSRRTAPNSKLRSGKKRLRGWCLFKKDTILKSFLDETRPFPTLKRRGNNEVFA